MSQNPPPAPTPPPSAAVRCEHCRSDDHWILHNVRLHGRIRKFCTSCLLKLHPASFCPICFSLHDAVNAAASAGKTVTCFKCSSLSHLTCVPPNVPKSPYLCPPCANPSFKFFDLRKPRKVPSEKVLEEEGKEEKQVLDQRAAKIFLTAARIAAVSMNKAVAVAKLDAERRVKEAAVARKRAKEAIDHVMALSGRVPNSGTANRRPNPNPNPNSGSAGPSKPNPSPNPNPNPGPGGSRSPNPNLGSAGSSKPNPSPNPNPGQGGLRNPNPSPSPNPNPNPGPEGSRGPAVGLNGVGGPSGIKNAGRPGTDGPGPGHGQLGPVKLQNGSGGGKDGTGA